MQAWECGIDRLASASPWRRGGRRSGSTSAAPTGSGVSSSRYPRARPLPGPRPSRC